MKAEVNRDASLGPLAAYRIGNQSYSPVADLPPVTFLHGFTQTATCGGPMLSRLASKRTVLSIDLPGHGESGDFADVDLWRSGDLVAETCGRSVFVGYSMGGRIALHLALRHPDYVSALVLIGATAGIVDAAQRYERRVLDDVTANRIETMGVAKFVETWLDQPMFAGLPENCRFVRERRSNSPQLLAQSIRQCGTGQMEPLWDRLGEISAPVLIMSGAADEKFTALGLRLREAIGSNAQIKAIPDAGHAVHLERPKETLTALTEFLTEIE